MARIRTHAPDALLALGAALLVLGVHQLLGAAAALILAGLLALAAGAALDLAGRRG